MAFLFYQKIALPSYIRRLFENKEAPFGASEQSNA